MTIQIQHVQPGDLITATFVNGLVAQIEQLDARVEALEGATPGPASGAVVITAVAPSPVRVGEDVTILGENFGFTIGAHRVRFDGIQPTAFRAGTSDTALICQVPALSNLPANGRAVTLSVSNATSTATRVITVLPAEIHQAGNLDMLFMDATPDPVTAGVDNDFRFTLASDAALPATITISPRVTVGGSPVGWPTAVLDAAKAEIQSRQITVNPGEEKTFFMRLKIPSGTNGTSFVLNVDGAGGGLTTSSGALPATVGQNADPDSTITLSPSTGVQGATITASANQIVTVNVEAGFTVVGTYDVAFAAVAGTSNWTTALISPPASSPRVIVDQDDLAASGGVNKTIQLRVRPNAGASDPGQARLTVQRQGANSNRIFTFDLNVS